ncbi:unnamed protein product, partial [Vitis vinifera]|uniref:Disease resistance protein winged helix domain-containing protein n=1 Tax=Vitis vinifera TaxID=29760 RepID=D7TGY1_VITVI
MEKVGEHYFDELLSKSFFQKSVSEKSCFVMHDLIHDLAQYISREFCIRIEDDKVQEISENTRHSLIFKRLIYSLYFPNGGTYECCHCIVIFLMSCPI